MSQADDWADNIISNLKRIRDAAQPIQQSGQTVQAGLDPDSVAAALAQAVKNDNSTTQAIAVRLANLAAKYPRRAY